MQFPNQAQLRTVLVVASCLVGLDPARAQAPSCPPGCIYLALGALQTPCTDDLSREATGTGSGQTLIGSFDFPSGVFRASAWAFSQNIDVHVDATDAFVVNGPTVGTPVSVTARLAISARASASCESGPHCTSSSVNASIQEQVAGIQSFTGYSDNSFARNLDLPIAATVGTPFNLRMIVLSQASGINTTSIHESSDSNITATLSFLNVPSGAQVTSCKGYTTAPVPNAPVSWGALKIRYH